MNQIRINEPTRSEMRYLFELALSGAKTEGGRQEVAKVAAYHELRWKAVDDADAAARKQAEEEANKPPAGKPAPLPAVVEHGMESPEAQAKRDARKAKRLANEAKRKAGKQPASQANNERAAKADDGTLPA